MQYRTMPRGHDKLSILGYGIMRMPTHAGVIDRRRAESMIIRAMDNGVNYLDTGAPYHAGQCEPFVGKLLEESGRRDEVKIAAKLPHWITKNADDMMKALEGQLRKLRTDRIDYYLIHNINGGSWQKAVDKGVKDFLSAALESGKILNAGFSWHGMPEDFSTVVDAFPWDFCQIQYNILDEKRQAGTAGLKYASQKGLGIIVMEPLRGGQLAKKIPPAASRLWTQMPEYSPAAWSLKWVWDHPEVTLLLSGMSEETHVEENLHIAAQSLPNELSENQLALIGKVQEAYRTAGAVGCTACRYCMPCPFGVSIPEVFDHYNEWNLFGRRLRDKMFYLSNTGGILSGTSGMASQCTACGACLPKCPQQLPIPDLMSRISVDFEGRSGRTIVAIGKTVSRILGHKRTKD